MSKLGLKYLFLVVAVTAGCQASKQSSVSNLTPTGSDRPLALVGQIISYTNYGPRSEVEATIPAGEHKSNEYMKGAMQNRCWLFAFEPSEQNRILDKVQLYKIAAYQQNVDPHYASVTLMNASDGSPADFKINCQALTDDYPFTHNGKRMIEVLSQFFKYKDYPDFQVSFWQGIVSPTPTASTPPSPGSGGSSGCQPPTSWRCETSGSNTFCGCR